MKKIYKLIILIIIICAVFIFKKTPKDDYLLDFTNIKENKSANEILLKYILDGNKEKYERFREFINAVEFDLNEDNENEIIGYVNHISYLGTAGYSFFILQKQNDRYIDIASMNFEPYMPVYILKTKTNRYRDILIHNGIEYKFIPSILKYKDDKYEVIKTE